MPGRKAMFMLAAALAAGSVVTTPAAAAGSGGTASSVDRRIELMQRQIDRLQSELDGLKQEKTQRAAAEATAQQPEQAAAADSATQETASAQDAQRPRHSGKGFVWDTSSTKTKDTGITIGGALRFQYTTGSYQHGLNHRGGDIDFDTFRLDLDGKVHGIILSTQWRWYSYMQTLQHGWIGYDFTPKNQFQLGLTRIPFGNQPFNSHNFFFSSDYYVGLEDTYAMGGLYVHSGDAWNVQAGFFKNDAATAASGLNKGYSYVVLGEREPGQGINAGVAGGAAARAINSGALRVARTFHPEADLSVEVGGSALYGMLGRGGASGNRNVGRYGAYAVHTNIDYRRWNFQAEAVHYAYRMDGHPTRMVVGAYAFYDTIPARANIFTLNGPYKLPVDWGPIDSLTFYNDNSLMVNKSGGLGNTFMIVTGMAISAGDLYTYFDFVNAHNQPFIGGSMGGHEHGVDNRLNINFGYYF
ncbi:MAG TPA: hypothetical protein VF265_09810 [Nevskiaceae bacterium]